MAIGVETIIYLGVTKWKMQHVQTHMWSHTLHFKLMKMLIVFKLYIRSVFGIYNTI